MNENEWFTRKKRIDAKLRSAGWTVVPYRNGDDLSILGSHAVEEFPTESGPADYARPEEYLALKWQDIDWQKKLAVFHRTVRWRKGGGWYLDEEMKTKLSRRTLPLPTSIIERLRWHRAKQAQEMLLLGPAYERMDFVFANEFGRPLHYGNITKRNYQKILKEAGLGHFTLYSLRHSCATLLLRNGVNIKVIQERLGHSDINLTLSVYAHVLEGMQAEASDNMQALLYGT